MWEIVNAIIRLINPSGCFKTGMIQSDRNKRFLFLYYYVFFICRARGWEKDQESRHGKDLNELRNLSSSLESGEYCREKYSKKNTEATFSGDISCTLMEFPDACVPGSSYHPLSWRTHIWKPLIDNSTLMNSYILM